MDSLVHGAAPAFRRVQVFNVKAIDQYIERAQQSKLVRPTAFDDIGQTMARVTHERPAGAAFQCENQVGQRLRLRERFAAGDRQSLDIVECEESFDETGNGTGSATVKGVSIR
jgi:hypothetical protein